VIEDKKIIVIMPAYNAESTLEKTFSEIPLDIVDEVILVDDNSSDKTVEIAKKLGIKTLIHPENMGYGANQKTCYKEALKSKADIIIMLHPDYQYSPRLIGAMAYMLTSGHYDVVIGSRILGKYALKGGMPLYKYIANRVLTFIQNIMVNNKLSEFHTGFRGYKREVIENLPLAENSNDFIFDNEFLCQVIYFGYKIGEISCPTKYFPEASSINFFNSVKYGIGVILTSIKFLLSRMGIIKFKIFSKYGKKLV